MWRAPVHTTCKHLWSSAPQNSRLPCALLAKHAPAAPCTSQACAELHQPYRIPARLVNFQITLEQAKERFQQWHGKGWLAPRRLLDSPDATLRAALLPFWLFEVECRVEYAGSVEIALETEQGGGVVRKLIDWKEVPFREYPWTLRSMQIYASYEHRRDLVEAAKSPGALMRTRPLLAHEMQGGCAEASRTQRWVKLDPPAMRQSVAWDLALRNIRNQEVEEAAASLRKQTGTDIVKDVRVRVEILRRRARLLFLPAYVANYSYGERFNAHGEREPMSYQAFIGGFGGEVVAERHYHPWKAQLAAAGLLGGLGMATAAVFANPGSVVAWEHGFWLFIVCLTAGAGARMAPQLLRQAAESRRIEEEEVDFERVLAAGVGPLDTGNAEQEAMRVNAEWRRWEDADKWNWNARKRQAWAEQLWRNQHTRCIQRARFVRNIEARRCQIIEARRLRQQAEAAMEEQRRRRWGHASHEYYKVHGFLGSQNVAGASDSLGYYRVLGIDANAKVTNDDIRRGFREAAMRWHPDKHEDGTSSAQLAREKFQRARTAYEVLRDADRRWQYDHGQV